MADSAMLLPQDAVAVPSTVDAPAPAAPRDKLAPKKRRVAAKSSNPHAKVKGRLGALEKFNDLPLDILADICWELDHESLLVLTVTSRVFRNVLLSPFASKIWDAARMDAGLPLLQAADMTQVQYASLVWGRSCVSIKANLLNSGMEQRCGKKGISKVHYTLRVRLCPKCTKENVVTNHHSKIPPALEDMDVTTLDCCPSNRISYGVQEYYLPALLALNKTMTERFFSKKEKPGILNSRIHQYLATERDVGLVYLDHGSDSDDDYEWDSDLDDFWGRPRATLVGPPTEEYDFIETKKAYVKKRQLDGLALNAWNKEQKEQKSTDKDAIRNLRRLEIQRRLGELGYDSTDFVDQTFRLNKQVNEPKLITERIWKNLQSALTTILDARRLVRAEEARIERMVVRRKAIEPLREAMKIKPTASSSDEGGRTTSARYYVPPARVFLTFPSVRELWEPESAVIVLNDGSIDRYPIVEDLVEFTRAFRRTFFTELVHAHESVAANVPSLPLDPLPVADTKDPTDAEIDLVLDNLEPIARCSRCFAMHSLEDLLVHVDHCGGIYMGTTSAIRDINYDATQFCLPVKHYRIPESALLILRAVEKALLADEGTKDNASSEPSTSSASAEAPKVVYCMMEKSSYHRRNQIGGLTPVDAINHMRHRHSIAPKEPALLDQWAKNLAFSTKKPDKDDDEDDDETSFSVGNRLFNLFDVFGTGYTDSEDGYSDGYSSGFAYY